MKNKADLVTSFEHIQAIVKIRGEDETVCFIQKWLKDPKMRVYESVRMIPPPMVCPEGVFNLWDGFSIEKHELKEPTKENMEDLEFLLDHWKRLCNREEEVYNYFLKWTALLFQQPGIKPRVMLLIKSRQGLGKQLGYYTPLANMIGVDRCYITQKVERDIFGNFNSKLENKLMVVLDEMDRKTACAIEEDMKDAITRDHDPITRKGVDTISVPSYCHYLSFSNNDFPWKINEDDRRFVAIDASPQTILDTDQVNRLKSISENKDVLRLLFDRLRSMDLTDFDPRVSRPETSFMNDLKEINRAPELQFMIEYICGLGDCRKQNEMEITGSELFEKFATYLKESSTYENKYNTTKIKFGMKIKQLDISGFGKKIYYVWSCL